MLSSFSFPTKIVSGSGALAELPAQLQALGISRPLVVTDGSLPATPAYRIFREALGAQVPLFSGVNPNPSEGEVMAAAAAYCDEGCDGVLGLGGGSALDVAKIVRVAVAESPTPWRDLTWKDDPGALAPFIAIPTTAGTGSEVGRSSVITMGKTKRVIFHPALLAKVVILEPSLTAGLPPKLTAATGVDALTHCIESFTSPVFHPLCDAIALEGARIAYAHLPGAVADGADLEHRSFMQIAAVMGGIAFQKELGATHSLSHPLSAHFGLNHGLANGLCLLPVLRFNAARKPGVYQRLANAIGLADTSDGAFIDAIQALLRQVGIVGGLHNQGVPEDAIDRLADAAFADGCHATNPVPVTRDELRGLYESAM
jgi:hypothetical protein